MAIRFRTLLPLATILVLTVPTHSESAATPASQFEFAWSAEERALAQAALSRLPPDLPRIDQVRVKMSDVLTKLTMPETITLGLALSRYYDRDDPVTTAKAQDLLKQISARSAMAHSATFGSTEGSSAFFNDYIQRIQAWNVWITDQALTLQVFVPAVTYYFSPSGSDSNDCKSTSTPCQTIAKVNSTRYNPGDNILFEGGRSFVGCVELSYATNVPISVPANPIVLGSYGPGYASINSNCPGVNREVRGPKSAAVNLNGVSVTIQDLIITANGTKTQYGILVQNGAGGTTNNVTIQRNIIYGFYSDAAQDSGSEIFVAGFAMNGVCGALNNVQILNNTLGDPSSATSNDQSGIAGYGCGLNITNVQEQGNIFKNMGGNTTFFHSSSGTVPNGMQYAIIQYNVAHDIGANNNSCGGGGGMWAYYSDSVTFQFNEAYNIQPLPIAGPGSGACDWNGFGFDGGVSNSVIQYNYSHHNGGSGIYTCVGCGSGPPTTFWGPNTIRYNITENNNSIGSGFQGELGLGNKATRLGLAYIYNNTLYSNLSFTSGSLSAPCISVNQGTFASGSVLANNICVMAGTNQYGQTIFYADNHVLTGGFTILNNAYYNLGDSPTWIWQGNNYNTLAAWAKASGGAINVTGSLTSNPLLTSPGAGGTCSWTPNLGNGPQSCPTGYKLRTDSPMIGAGLNLTASPYNLKVGTRDYYGNTIPHAVGTGYNIGADGGAHPCRRRRRATRGPIRTHFDRRRARLHRRSDRGSPLPLDMKPRIDSITTRLRD
jgi:hypothetical protein